MGKYYGIKKGGYAIPCSNDPDEIMEDENAAYDITEGEDEEVILENRRKKEVKRDLSQWSGDDDCIVPVSKTFSRLKAGYYTISSSTHVGIYFSRNNVQLNKLYRLPNTATDILMNDISKFWTLEETYKKYNRVYRRNYLLYSAPGTGKTSLINLMCHDLIEKYDGIVISLSTSHEIEIYIEALKKFRKVEPDRKIITVIEDIDNFISNNGRYNDLDTYLLNILDGNMKIGGIVTIATTNFIEQIENRYKNRPSRFDRVVEFPLPNEESRRIFIQKSVCEDDISKIDVDEWVRKTEGFTIDHINELILLFFVFGHSEEESFDTITKMVRRNDKLANKTSVTRGELGFESDDEY